MQRSGSLRNAGASTVHDAIVISSSDLERMRRSVLKEQPRTEAEDRRARLRTMSQARVARWPNTLAAQRKQKEEARKRREEAEEAKRREVDKLEEDRRREERRQLIQRANKILYEQTDRMKQLRSQMMFSDILDERRRQAAAKIKLQEMEVAREAHWMEVQKREMAKMKEREEREAKEREAKAQHVAVIQQAQLDEYKDRFVEQLLQEKAEGEDIAQKAKEEEGEDRRKAAAMRQKLKDDAMAMVQQNEHLKALRAKEKEAEAAEMERIRRHAVEMERVTVMRRNHEADKHTRKMASVQRMIDRAVEHLQQMKDTEDERIAAQVEEARLKNEAEMERRAEFRRKQLESIDRSRRAQIENRLRQKEHEEREGKQFARQWRVQQKMIEEEERREYEMMREKGREHQAFLQQQAEEKELREQRERHADLYAALQAQEAAKREDERFDRHVKEVTGEYKTQGKGTVMLERCRDPPDEIALAALAI